MPDTQLKTETVDTAAKMLEEAMRLLNSAVAWLEHFQAINGLNDDGPVGGKIQDIRQFQKEFAAIAKAEGR